MFCLNSAISSVVIDPLRALRRFRVLALRTVFDSFMFPQDIHYAAPSPNPARCRKYTAHAATNFRVGVERHTIRLPSGNPHPQRGDTPLNPCRLRSRTAKLADALRLFLVSGCALPCPSPLNPLQPPVSDPC